MAYSAILGRLLGRPVINLGFSGNGRAEPPLAEVLGELRPAVMLIDCLPNRFLVESQRLVKRAQRAGGTVRFVF